MVNKAILKRLDAFIPLIQAIAITSLINDSYRAEIHVALSKHIRQIPMAPSEAILLAVSNNIPLYVRKTLLDQESIIFDSHNGSAVRWREQLS